MQESVMKAWWESSPMAGGNAAYVEEMYEAYLEDPNSVSQEWKFTFDKLPKVDGVEVETNHTQIKAEFKHFASLGPVARFASGASTSSNDAPSDDRQVKVLQIINAYRFRGHQHANLDPLGLWQANQKIVRRNNLRPQS